MQHQLDFNTIMLFLIAALNAFSAYLSHRNGKAINTIEKATNSMKDALVETTAKASLAEGTAIGRREVHVEVDERAAKLIELAKEEALAIIAKAKADAAALKSKTL